MVMHTMFSNSKRANVIRSTLRSFATTSNNVPIIDISSFLCSGPNERTAKNHGKLIDELRDVGSNIGFFYLTGFNDIVSQKLINDTINESKTFFNLPLSDKMTIHTSTTPYLRGYIGIGDQGSYGFDLSDKRLENMKDTESDTASIEMNDKASTLGDLKEVFKMGTELPQTHEYFNDLLFGENIFPNKDFCPQFELIMKEYYDSVLKLSDNLFQLFAISMDKEYNYFDNLVNQGMNSMNVLRYIPKFDYHDNEDQASEDGELMQQFGIGEHTDFECFTILLQDVDGPSGLEILVNDNENQRKWQRLKPIKNTFVINFGDILARYSNDMFQSTVHRAVNDYNKSRYSVAFFRHCNFDTKVENLMINDKNKYQPVIAGQHMLDRVTRANQQPLQSLIK